MVAQSRISSQPGGYSNPASDPFGGSSPGFGQIIGTVRTLDGHGVSNAHIEARDIQQGTRSVYGQSDSGGSFALYNISPGTYEVMVTSGLSEAHERVEVIGSSGEARVDIHLPSPAESKGGSGSTISYSQYRVPQKARALFEKAVQYMKQNKLDESREKVNAALAICPKFSEALTLRGILLGRTGSVSDAIANFQQAIQYDPNYALAYIALGSVLNSKARFDESLPILGQAERIAPTSWQVYFESARANIGKGHFATALHDIDRAAELQGGEQKETPEVHLVRGYALIGMNEVTRAIHELEIFLAHESPGGIADNTRKVLDQLRALSATASR
jgi:Flp pilus assembly protein TadD